jgi:hypothetical protein
MASGKPVELDQEAQWLSQWKAADSALHEQHVSELRRMTPADAWAAIEAVLTFPIPTPLSEERRVDSGLVEIQAYFRKLQVK